MKKIALLLVCLLLCSTALVACGGGDTTTTTTTTPGGGTTPARTTVTADEFAAVRQFGENWKLVMVSTHPTEGTMSEVVMREGNKFSMVSEMKDAQGAVVDANSAYAEIVGAVFYEYIPRYNASEELEGYRKEVIEGTVQENIEGLLDGYIPSMFLDFTKYTYNEQTKRYELASIQVEAYPGGPMTEVINVAFTFADGKLKGFDYSIVMGGATVTYQQVYSYGNAAVTLPTNIITE